MMKTKTYLKVAICLAGAFLLLAGAVLSGCGGEKQTSDATIEGSSPSPSQSTGRQGSEAQSSGPTARPQRPPASPKPNDPVRPDESVGDEEPARVPVDIRVSAGGVLSGYRAAGARTRVIRTGTAPVYMVPPFFAVQLTVIRSGASAPQRLTVSGPGLRQPLKIDTGDRMRVERSLPGLRTNERYRVRFNGLAVKVLIEANAEPGP